MSECDNGKMKFMGGLFLGGIIGALVIFFLGTKEGRKAGKYIQKKGEEFIDDIEEKVGEIKEKGEDLIEQGEDLKNRVIAEVEEKKQDLSHETVKRIDSALASVEKVQEKGLEATGNLRKHFTNLPKKG